MSDHEASGGSESSVSASSFYSAEEEGFRQETEAPTDPLTDTSNETKDHSSGTSQPVDQLGNTPEQQQKAPTDPLTDTSDETKDHSSGTSQPVDQLGNTPEELQKAPTDPLTDTSDETEDHSSATSQPVDQLGNTPEQLQKVPKFLLCELSGGLIDTPLLSKSGYSFDKKALETFSRENKGSKYKHPKTKKQLQKVENHYFNSALQHLIEEFKNGKLFQDVSVLSSTQHGSDSPEIHFVKPVTSPNGITYEKEEIETTINRGDRKVLKRLQESENIKITDFYPNHPIIEACKYYDALKTKQPEEVHVQTDNTSSNLSMRIEPDKTCTVCFHLLLPFRDWGFPSRSCSVHMEFHIGDVKILVKPSITESAPQSSPDLAIIKVWVAIDTSLLHHSLPPIHYRYCISKASAHTANPPAIPECIYDTSSTRVSVSEAFRQLDLPRNFRFADGCESHIYDTIVYPHKFLKYWGSGQTDEMHKKCIDVYMGSFIQSNCMIAHDICRCDVRNVEQTFHLFESFCETMENRKVVEVYYKAWLFQSGPSPQASVGRNYKNFYNEIVNWICRRKNKQQALCKQQKLVSAILLLCFLAKIVLEPTRRVQITNDKEIVRHLLGELSVEVDIQQESIPCYDKVIESVGTTFNGHVSRMLQQFLVSKDFIVDTKVWMSVLSWVHFIDQKVKPFDNPEAKDIVWEPTKLRIPSSLKRMNLPELSRSNLIKADPLLLPYCFKLLQPQDHCTVVRNMRPDYSLLWFTKAVKTNASCYTPAQVLNITGNILVTATDIGSDSPKQLLNATIDLFDTLLRAGHSVLGKEKWAITRELSCLALTLINSACEEQLKSDQIDEGMLAVMSKFRSNLKAIFNKAFEEVFGGFRKDCKGEFQAWRTCTDLIEERRHLWIQRVITPVITERVKKMNPAEKLRMFFEFGSEQSVLNDIIMQEASRSEVLEDQIKKEPKQVLSQLKKSKIHSKHLNYVMSVALQCNSAQRAGRPVDIGSLINWPFWPFIFRKSGGESFELPEEPRQMFNEAIKCADEFCDQISSQTVSLEDFNQVQGKKKFNELVEALISVGLLEKDFMKGYERIGFLVAKYEERQKLLKHLCGHLTELDETTLPGIKELRHNVESGVHDSLQVCQICVPRQTHEEFSFPAFQMADSELPTVLLTNFMLLATEHKNDFFDEAWIKCFQKAKENQLTFSSIVADVWTPAYEQCEVLLSELKNCSISLSEVDKQFSKYEIAVLKKQVQTLSSGFNKVKSSAEKIERAEIDFFVDTVRNYREIKKYREAADALGMLREKLHLKGDFFGARKLVQVTSAGDLSLCDIDTTVIETAQDFKESVSNQARVQCLQKIADCCEIILWIRSNVKDLSDLQTFVTLAMETGACGEDTLSKNRMSSLHTVGSDFASLIFNLPTDANLAQLLAECSPVWKALDSNPDLIQVLEGCNQDLDWYNDVKNTQGDVEKNSYRQLENILEFGVFMVGNEDVQGLEDAKSRKLSNVSSMVCLHLRDEESRSEQKLTKTYYSLGELGDLESRLVLITGTDSEKKENASKFLMVLPLVRRIAQALLDLGQSGYINYIGWSLRFACRKFFHDYSNQLSGLLQIAQQLEEILESWRKNIDKARKKYYELNYYTTKQLLYLRYALHVLEVNHEHQDMTDSTRFDLFAGCSKERLLSLLRSISKQVSSTGLIQVIEGNDNSELKDKVTIESFDTDSCPNASSTPDVSTADCSKCSSVSGDDTFQGEKHRLFVNLVENYRYSTLLACEATKKFDDEDEAVDWCEDNCDDPQYSDAQYNATDTQGQLPSEIPESNFPQSSYFVGHGDVSHLHIEDIDDRLRFNNDHDVYHVQSPQVSRIGALTLDELGYLLGRLSNTAASSVKRPFPSDKGLLTGVPNLVVTNEENVFKTTLSLYMENESLPFPSLEEVLVCSEETTEEEVTVFWQRAILDPQFCRVFCLVHAEKLAFTVTDKCVTSLLELIMGKTEYRLVIVCSDTDESRSNIFNRLHLYRRNYALKTDKAIEGYIRSHLQSQESFHACSVDMDRSTVRVILSQRAGMGKSLYVNRLSKELSKTLNLNPNQVLVTVPIQGPHVSHESIISLLEAHRDDSEHKIFLLDIDSTVLSDVVSPLFCLLILEGLSDRQGRVWRRHPSQLYCVEVTLDHRDSKKDIYAKSSLEALLDVLPKVNCVGPMKILQLSVTSSIGTETIKTDDEEFQSSAYQRVYQYLKRHEQGGTELDRFKFQGGMEDEEKDWLRIFLRYCGLLKPSWREIRHFVQFLNIQLQSAEVSHSLPEDSIRGLKAFIVKFLIRMSTDFATSSLQGEVEEEQEDGGETSNFIEKLQIKERNHWEQRPHPYIFFNKDRSTATFVGFHLDDSGDLIDPRIEDKRDRVIEKQIVSKTLVSSLKQIGIQEEDDEEKTLLKRLLMFLDIPETSSPDDSYVLTKDNFIKILGILMRFRCGVPVILMGETGCGKTSLVRFMCALCATGAPIKDRSTIRNMFILKVHGGTTKEMIVKKVEEAIRHSEVNLKLGLDTVLFFDEANTTDAIGLIKEVICDCRILGTAIPRHIKFVAACNPYRKHSDAMINKLESAGLGYYVKNSRQKLGTIPLRQLVYRVRDLPPSMRPLVYDFGRLTDETEKQYTEKIVQKYVGVQYVDSVSQVLACSQQYMRNREDECSFVSLRDVERCMLVFSFFKDNIGNFKDLIEEMCTQDGIHSEYSQKTVAKIDDISRALILALSVCYHARLSDRKEYETKVHTWFKLPLYIPGGEDRFCKEIYWCQEVVLSSLKIPDNVAHNTALRENVFMMAVCIELRIPLFLVGKPGSSKSLAKTILSTSMQGQTSSSDLLKTFKQIQMFSYQCSKYSTPESVIEVFKTAKEFQEKQDVNRYVSVVVLDEVGLAEDAPSLPLKALHPLLEDGSVGGDSTDEVIKRENRVAFVGISNWALDPAKMNRGVMVTRGDPNDAELVQTARGICSNAERDPVAIRLNPYFDGLARSYVKVCQQVNAEREFYGLRDFYSLIKMLYWISKESGQLNSCQFEYVVKRNFGGSKSLNAWDVFSANLGTLPPPSYEDTDTKVREYIEPPCNPVGLIRSSLLPTSSETWEDRYLLFLTENYTALQTLQDYLFTRSEEAISESGRQKPKIMFGSSFPKDKEYTQTCRTINEIKLCMETGQMVVLLNLENLYESLYDALNQYYLHHGGKRYVDLGLQSHRMKCQVHKDFRLILIAESKKVYDTFPTPLINRLEKHYILSKTLLSEWQLEVLSKLEDWIDSFVKVTDEHRIGSFEVADCFVGFKSDTAAAVLFHVTTIVKKSTVGFDEILKIASTSTNDGALATLLKEKVLLESKKLLTRTATPDSIVRLQCTNLPAEEHKMLSDCYFHEQHHYSLRQLLHSYMELDSCENTGLAIQVTTHGPLLNKQEVMELHTELMEALLKENKGRLFDYSLQEFDTEDDFITSCGEPFKCKEEALLVLQCDSGHLNGDLIACARHRLYDLRKDSKAHIVFIIHLPRYVTASSFVGFQGDPWICYHLDDLLETDDYGFKLTAALEKNISELFYSGSFTENDSDASDEVLSESKLHLSQGQCVKLNACIQTAVSQASADNVNRSLEQIDLLLSCLTTTAFSDRPLKMSTFHGVLVSNILRCLQDRERDLGEEQCKQWYLMEALNAKSLRLGGTFRNTLSLKIENLLSPLLAANIQIADVNCNMDLLRDEEVMPLWVKLFQQVSDSILEKGSILSLSNFKCKTPFHWVLQKVVQSEVCVDEYSKDLSPVEWFKTVHPAVKEKLSFGPLVTADCDHCSLLKKFYLHDFVRSVHPSSLKTAKFASTEYELIEDSLDRICTALLDSIQHQDDVFAYITMVHIVSENQRTKLNWFQEIVPYAPAILKMLKKQGEIVCNHDGEPDSPNIVLHFYATKEALSFLLDDLHKYLVDASEKNLRSWLCDVQDITLVCTSVLSLSWEDELMDSIRQTWMKLHVLKVLIECIILEESSLTSFARRMSSIFRRGKDHDETFKKVLALVVKLRTETEKKLAGTKGKKHLQWRAIVENGMSIFLIEFITCLCFGQSVFPGSSLMSDLLEFFPLVSKQIAFVDPAVQMHLFQTISTEFDMKDDQVITFLRDFLERALRYRQEGSSGWLYFLQSCENSFVMSADGESDKDICWALEQLELEENIDPQDYPRVMIAIGMLRNFLTLFTVALEKAAHNQSEVLYSDFSGNKTEEVLENPFAVDFTLRTIVRKYGFHRLCELRISRGPVIQKLFDRYPLCKETTLIDPLFVYGDVYNDQREKMADAVVNNNLQTMNIKGIARQDVACWILTLNEKIHLLLQECKEPSQTLEQLKTDISKCELLKEEIVQRIAKQILTDLLPQTRLMDDYDGLLLSPLIIHAVLVIACNKQKRLISQLASLLQLHQGSEDILLPTMPDESAIECCNEVQVLWCSKGHGSLKSTKVEKCGHCGEKLKHEGDTSVALNSRGHLFGDPDRRSDVPIPVRDLSSASCLIIRFLIHTLLFWNSSNTTENGQHHLICKLLKLDEEDDITLICWKHIKKDTSLLMTALGCNLEEVCLVLHILLKEMMYKCNTGLEFGAAEDSSLDSPEKRRQWEKTFDEQFIEPVLLGIDKKIQHALLSNSRKSHDQYYTMMYKPPATAEGLQPALWSFPPYGSIGQTMEVISSLKHEGKHIPKFLNLFLQNEPLLRATQYLPEIVQLQIFLHNTFHHSLPISKAECTIDEFILQIKEEDALLLNQLKVMFLAFQNAWKLVKETLFVFAAHILKAKCEDIATTVDGSRQLKCLIPTLTGPGISSAALVMLLVSVHNTFVSTCQNLPPASKRTRRRQVPLSQIQQCHLLDYENKIDRLFLCFSCTSVKDRPDFTNLCALEKHFCQEFVQGKPTIVPEYRMVTYKQEGDMSLVANIAAVSKHVPQRELVLEVQMKMLDEINEMQHLREAFETVKIVLQFVTTRVGSVSDRIGDYVERTLHMKRHHLIVKALNRCTLQNVVSVWRTLGSTLARYHVNEDPFDKIADWMREDFEPDDKEDFKKILASIGVEMFLMNLFDFIERSLRQFSEESKDKGLLKCLDEHIRDNDLRILSRLNEKFPKTITVSRAVAVWRYVASECYRS